MYIPESFRVRDQHAIFSFIEQYDFATMITSIPGGNLAITHLPLLLNRREDPALLVGHVAEKNDHWRHFDGTTKSLAIFRGPHGYVSPTWYPNKPAVPTWNYAVVHVYGYPRLVRDRLATTAILASLVRKYEGPRPNPWQIEDLPPDFYREMVTRIVAFEMPIDKIDAKFKLSQNRTRVDRDGAARGLGIEGSQSAMDLQAFMLEDLNGNGEGE
jgi:transcriptional regulator